MEKRKLRVGIVTSSLLAKTGFSNNARAILPYLFRLDKYELFHLNQGIGDTPEFARYPWRNEGVFKNFDQARFQVDDIYKRHVSYGNTAVEQFVINNKIDVLLAIEDGWAFEANAYFNSRWWPYIKENFLIWTTIDSLGILPIYKEWAEKSSNFWVWASFAERALKQENPTKFSHVKTVHGCLNTKDYHPISKNKKEELRKKFNIDPNTTIFLQLGRGQLRKLFPQTIESYGKFKKQNPKANTKLFLFMGWYEGWPYERLIQDAGLKKEDVLAPYFCKNCPNWEIKPYEGEFKDCRFCGTKGQSPNPQNPNGSGQKTCGVDSAITNAEMSYVYGIADAAVSVFTSGGLEFFSAESLLCGLPLLCTDYSCGEDFTKNDFVFSLDGVFTYEAGTGFKKHVPNINTMVKFYEKIYNMPEEKRKDIGRRGREWALKTFDITTIGPKLEEWLDSRKKIEWDYKYKDDIKNLSAQLTLDEFNLPDPEFVKISYKKLLNMDVTDKDEGFIHWCRFLAQNGDKTKLKEQMLVQFKNAALAHNNKVQPVPFEACLNKDDDGKRILYIMPESIGDVFLSTSIFESLKKQYPWAKLYVATKPQFFEILEGNPHIDKIINYIPEMDSQLWLEGQGGHKGFFEVSFHPYFSSQKMLNYLNNGKTNPAFDLKLENK